MKTLKRLFYIIDFIFYYLIKLIQANIFIAYDILTPKMYMKPAFMEVPVKVNTQAGLLLLSNLLSMTPGTLSVDINRSRTKVLVHVLYYSGEELMQKDFDNIQSKIIRITE